MSATRSTRRNGALKEFLALDLYGKNKSSVKSFKAEENHNNVPVPDPSSSAKKNIVWTPRAPRPLKSTSTLTDSEEDDTAEPSKTPVVTPAQLNKSSAAKTNTGGKKHRITSHAPPKAPVSTNRAMPSASAETVQQKRRHSSPSTRTGASGGSASRSQPQQKRSRGRPPHVRVKTEVDVESRRRSRESSPNFFRRSAGIILTGDPDNIQLVPASHYRNDLDKIDIYRATLLKELDIAYARHDAVGIRNLVKDVVSFLQFPTHWIHVADVRGPHPDADDNDMRLEINRLLAQIDDLRKEKDDVTERAKEIVPEYQRIHAINEQLKAELEHSNIRNEELMAVLHGNRMGPDAFHTDAPAAYEIVQEVEQATPRISSPSTQLAIPRRLGQERQYHHHHGSAVNAFGGRAHAGTNGWNAGMVPPPGVVAGVSSSNMRGRAGDLLTLDGNAASRGLANAPVSIDRQEMVLTARNENGELVTTKRIAQLETITVNPNDHAKIAYLKAQGFGKSVADGALVSPVVNRRGSRSFAAPRTVESSSTPIITIADD